MKQTTEQLKAMSGGGMKTPMLNTYAINYKKPILSLSTDYNSVTCSNGKVYKLEKNI